MNFHHNSKKKSEIWFFFRLSTFRIIHMKFIPLLRREGGGEGMVCVSFLGTGPNDWAPSSANSENRRNDLPKIVHQAMATRARSFGLTSSICVALTVWATFNVQVQSSIMRKKISHTVLKLYTWVTRTKYESYRQGNLGIVQAESRNMSHADREILALCRPNHEYFYHRA